MPSKVSWNVPQWMPSAAAGMRASRTIRTASSGSDMVGLHDVARQIGADRQDGEAERPVRRRRARPAAVAPAGVAGEEDVAAGQAGW